MRPTDTDEVVSLLRCFAVYPSCFTLGEFLVWLDPEVDIERVKQQLLNDRRFVNLNPHGKPFRLLARQMLVKWWINLNVRLATIGYSRLTERALALTMSSVRPEGRWIAPPASAIRIGERLGLVAEAWTDGEYMFPLARILSFFPHQLRDPFFMDFLESLSNDYTREQILERSLEDRLSDMFRGIDDRTKLVVRSREGFFGCHKRTLKEIGAELGVTRERARQICMKGRGRLTDPSRKGIFAKLLLSSIMNRKGSLIYNRDSKESTFLRFSARCGGVPLAECPEIGLSLLGVAKNEIVLACKKFRPVIDVITVGSEIEKNLCLAKFDVEILAHKIGKYREEDLVIADRVILALQHLGKPAHYSKITEVHNALFPRYRANYTVIHSALVRYGQELDEGYSFVWIGRQGTYGLKEWGYEKPKKGLFLTVGEIVRQKYEEIKRPVPYTVISAELGKIRPTTPASSLALALAHSPYVRRVSRDTYIPETSTKRRGVMVSEQRIDKVLSEFEAEKSGT